MKKFITALLIVAAALLPMSAAGASSKIPPMPTQQQINSCVKAVTSHKPLTAKQVNGCLAAVWQTYLGQQCPQDPTNTNEIISGPYVKPSGYIISLGHSYRGIAGKAAHSWAIRAGSRPYQVKSSDTQQSIDAAICAPARGGEPKPKASTSTTVAWCGLSIGESKADVLAQMGPANGTKATALTSRAQSAGIDTVEWDVGNDIFLATLDNGNVVNLQAYAGVVGPVGAMDLSCAPFRNDGG